MFSSDIFIALRYAVSTRATQPTDMISSQDICDNLQKQDTRRVLRNHGVGEVNHGAGINLPQAPSCYRTPSDPDRRFQLLRHRGRPPVNVGSEFNRHHVWYVFILVLAVGRECRGLLIVGGA